MGKSELLTLDLAFVIEAEEEPELPERLLAVVRLHKLNMDMVPEMEDWESGCSTMNVVNVLSAGDDEDTQTTRTRREKAMTANSYIMEV